MALHVLESFGQVRPGDTTSVLPALMERLSSMTCWRYFCAAYKVRHRWLVAPMACRTSRCSRTAWRFTHDLHQTACVECFHEHNIITFRVIVAFDVIRGTKLAGLLSCAVLRKDDRYAVVQPFTAAVAPVAKAVCRVALHPTLLN